MNFIKNILFLLITWSFIAICYALTSILNLKNINQLKLNKNKGKCRILFLPMFFPENAGFHYRVWKWKVKLEGDEHTVDIKGLFKESTFNKLTSGNNLRRFLVQSMFKRFMQLLSCRKYDVIIVRRKLLPYNDYGQLFMEKLLLSINSKVILDFDDDLTNNKEGSKSDSLFGRILLEDKLSFYTSLKLYPKLIAGSHHLRDLALKCDESKHKEDILVLPTCVDYSQFNAKKYPVNSEKFIFGWIGSNTNQFYLDSIVNALNHISTKWKIKLLVISGKPYASHQASFEIENRKWSLESEVKDLYDIDIGLMPLENNKRCRAKCGFKLIQYMGLGLISISSAIGANKEIVTDGSDGFLVRHEQEWLHAIEQVLMQKELFNDISTRAKQKIEQHYSVNTQYVRLLNFILNESIHE